MGDNYLIVRQSPGPARHRLGTPGLRHRPVAGAGWRARPRHAVPVPARVRHARSALAVVVLGTLAVSTWFIAAGATAFAEMLAP